MNWYIIKIYMKIIEIWYMRLYTSHLYIHIILSSKAEILIKLKI